MSYLFAVMGFIRHSTSNATHMILRLLAVVAFPDFPKPPRVTNKLRRSLLGSPRKHCHDSRTPPLLCCHGGSLGSWGMGCGASASKDPSLLKRNCHEWAIFENDSPGTDLKPFDAAASKTAKNAHKDFTKFANAVIRALKVVEEKAPPECNPLFTQPQYPMYVMRISDFLALEDERLPSHETVMQRGVLYEVQLRPERFGMFYVYETLATGKRGNPILHDSHNDKDNDTERLSITEESRDTEENLRVFHPAMFTAISHNWMQPNENPQVAHPDRDDGIKFIALKSYLSQEHIHTDHFIWMDYLSTPQAPDSREKQCQAIRSLPVYFMWSTNVLVICQTLESFSNTSSGYLSRGHCLMELASSKLPRIDVFNKWYIPGIDKERGEWGVATVLAVETLETKVLDWEDFQHAGSPLEGNFTLKEDIDLIYSMMCSSWKEAMDLNKEKLPQMLGLLNSTAVERNLVHADVINCSSPTDWVNSTVLPKAYVEMLRKSIDDRIRLT